MTFDFPHSPISMLQSVFTKLPDVLPANFFNIEWGRWEIVILVMIWGKNMQFFDCSKVFWPELWTLFDIVTFVFTLVTIFTYCLFAAAEPYAKKLPHAFKDFRWSYTGKVYGYKCVRIFEPKDPNFKNTYFCWRANRADPEIRWSSEGKTLIFQKLYIRFRNPCRPKGN